MKRYKYATEDGAIFNVVRSYYDRQARWDIELDGETLTSVATLAAARDVLSTIDGK